MAEDAVAERYGRIARSVLDGGRATDCAVVSAGLYDDGEVGDLPDRARVASLGCGNPSALADLHPGETVLDLGSGGGLDVLLSGRRVGPAGRAYGVDASDDMLELARQHQREAGVANVEFLKGAIEAVPLPDASVDVVISNCVLNLAADKRRVLAEAFRLLRPGGCFAVSDVAAVGELADDVRRATERAIGCVVGTLHEAEYRSLLGDVGFTGACVSPTRQYRLVDGALQSDEPSAGPPGTGALCSVFVRAVKPVTGAA